jgi:hypothetical protein
MPRSRLNGPIGQQTEALEIRGLVVDAHIHLWDLPRFIPNLDAGDTLLEQIAPAYSGEVAKAVKGAMRSDFRHEHGACRERQIAFAEFKPVRGGRTTGSGRDEIAFRYRLPCRGGVSVQGSS